MVCTTILLVKSKVHKTITNIIVRLLLLLSFTMLLFTIHHHNQNICLHTFLESSWSSVGTQSCDSTDASWKLWRRSATTKVRRESTMRTEHCSCCSTTTVEASQRRKVKAISKPIEIVNSMPKTRKKKWNMTVLMGRFICLLSKGFLFFFCFLFNGQMET